MPGRGSVLAPEQLSGHCAEERRKGGNGFMLYINHFSKSYGGDRYAVKDLTLHVAPGEIYGFLGHNGAGKSTTLRAVAGVLDFTEGDITVGGHSIRTDPVAAKRIMAFLPDNPDLYDFMTGIRYLNFIADVYGISAEERTSRIARYGDAFELTKDLGGAIGGYSHGMKQKLALISAFLRQPRLLILDEPFVGLDPNASYTLKTMLRELCHEGGAVFFSTHVLEVAEKLCDKLAILRSGRLIEAGPTAEIVGKSNLEEVFLQLEREEAGQ